MSGPQLRIALPDNTLDTTCAEATSYLINRVHNLSWVFDLATRHHLVKSSINSCMPVNVSAIDLPSGQKTVHLRDTCTSSELTRQIGMYRSTVFFHGYVIVPQELYVGMGETLAPFQ